MKKLPITLALLVPQLALAQQQLSKVTVERASVVGNEIVRLNVESSDGRTTTCGLIVIFGDGDTREVRIGVDPMPITHQFEYPGRYGIRVEPKTVVRGIGTAFPCTGDAQTVRVTVLDPNEDRNNTAANLATRSRMLNEKEASLRAWEDKLNARDAAAAIETKSRASTARSAPKSVSPPVSGEPTPQTPTPKSPTPTPPPKKPDTIF